MDQLNDGKSLTRACLGGIILNAAVLYRGDGFVIAHVSVPAAISAQVRARQEYLGETRGDVFAVYPELAGTRVVETDQGPVEVEIMPRHRWM